MEMSSSLPDEFEKLALRMSAPKVVVDNAVCANTTIVKVDSARKYGILLEAVQALTDLHLSVKKAYISSDGKWFMDVFHVTDINGNKLTDDSVINCIKESLGSIHQGSGRTSFNNGLTALELTGTDRVGLLSEVFAVLDDLQCNVVESKVWTHDGRVASLIYVTDCNSGSPIEDSNHIDRIAARLRNVLKGDDDIDSAKTSVSFAMTHVERRLHQMMFADGDYERKPMRRVTEDSAAVTVQKWAERGYSVVSVHCRDRMNLLFDVVCNLTYMEYIVYHGKVSTVADTASMEFYIKHRDGTPISTEEEGQRVIQCLQAAVERRPSKGVRLELCTKDQRGLLANVTRTFRENALNVTRAKVSTSDNTAMNIFYVTDAHGNQVDPKIIEEVRNQIGLGDLQVKEIPLVHDKTPEGDEGSAGNGIAGALGSLVKRNLFSLGLIRSLS